MVFAGLFFFASLVFGASRGLIWRWWRRMRRRQGIRAERLLVAFQDVVARHAGDDPFRPHNTTLLRQADVSVAELNRLLWELERKGWIERVDEVRWALTRRGHRAASALKVAQDT